MLLTWLISTFEFQLFSLISLFQGVENVCAMERGKCGGEKWGAVFRLLFLLFLYLKTYQEAPNRQTDWKGAQIFTCTAWVCVSAWVYTAPSEADYPANLENLSYSSLPRPTRRPPQGRGKSEFVKTARRPPSPGAAGLTLSHCASQGPRMVPRHQHVDRPSPSLPSRPNFRVPFGNRNPEWEAHQCAEAAMVLRASFAKCLQPTLSAF